MIFSSILFTFLFLPIVLGLHFIIPKRFRNLFILFTSLFFYAWGEQVLVLLMIGLVCINYVIGNIMSEFQKKNRERNSKTTLITGLIINLTILGYFKYSHFSIDILSQLGLNLDISKITLPIGISFFTFQSLSYLIDVYRKNIVVEKNLINLGMYISLFPQLVAGPIVRYADISKEILNRNISISQFKIGITRFIVGFAKKVLIANNVGLIADEVFAIAPDELSTSLGWIGIICYSIQIYYDFSGYSDMAIGLGKMLGFNFNENFRHPYMSKSIREFWRRWHISLSSWFKDYLYISLGGNRKGKYWTYANLLIVFIITGLWHGASWNFVVWGMFHGLFLIIERFNITPSFFKLNIFSRVYTLLVVMIGWVIFRAENLELGIHYITKLFSFTSGSNNYPYIFINNFVLANLLIGIVFSFPVRKLIARKTNSFLKNTILVDFLNYSFYILLFIFSITELAHSTYNPFIYFRF